MWGRNSMTERRRYEGSCHCGAVRFRLKTKPPRSVLRCNCSICELEDFLHWIIPVSEFEVIQGSLTTYRFGTTVAQHTFCSVCGIKPFYYPRSNPDGVSVNVRCVDGLDWRKLDVTPFNGVQWEQNAASIAHLSKESN